MKRSFDVATEILRSQHRNKLNTDKQGGDILFHLTIKNPTQGREVLLRHKDELKDKSLITT